jgi:TRAP-type C4-dicarboxylate transport system permease small subunit
MLAELDQRSQSADIPLVLPQAALPLGLVLMALLIAIRLIVRGTTHPDIVDGPGV